MKRFILVSENDIADAIQEVYHIHHERIEGAAGVAVAALMKDALKYQGQRVVAIVCGGNIDDEKFRNITEQ